MGAKKGVNCEHIQALETDIFQRHWECQEDSRIDQLYEYNTVFVASLDGKTAFDVAKPSVSKFLTWAKFHGQAALLAVM